MTIAAGMLVKDEHDVILQTIHHLLRQGVDHVYVMDNESTDGTWGLLESVSEARPSSVTLMHDPEVGYYQSRKMTDLLARATDDGHAWLVPCDADELWSGESEFDTVRDVLDGQPSRVKVVTAALYDHYPTSRDDVQQPDPFQRLVWRVREPQSLPKVAVRCRPGVVIEQGNHGAYHEQFGDMITAPGLRVDHYPYRSADQFIRKARNGAAAYAAAPDLPENMGVHWRTYGDILERSGEAGLRAFFRGHFYYHDPDGLLDMDSHARAA